ncbi:MAG: ABC transporter permease, partial [Longimicrobiales bacterium]|nr:ABC transporter permease [Longimicrobiales bacterium]
MTSDRPRLAVRASAALYRVLLLRFPRSLRRRYGHDMHALFVAEATRRTRREGLRGLAAVWAKAVRDLVRPLPGAVGPGTPEDSPRRSGMTEDLSFAARDLIREPRFTILLVTVLAVGMAFNTTALAVLNAYLLRPLPFPEAHRLVNVRGGQGISWREVEDVFELAVSWDLDVFTIVGDGRPELAPGAWVTPDFLATYGVSAEVGRTFRPDEAGRDGAPVAMISHRLWQERFGGDPDVVGRTFSAFTSDRPDHAELFTIVGVLPVDFWYFNEYTEVLAPIRDDRTVYAGRLRQDVSVGRAETILTDRVARRMERVPEGFRVTLVSVQESHASAIRPTLVALQAAALLVLLIACANAAVLLLIRSTRRERELEIRRALGASGGRLARQLMLEGGLISAAATGLALVFTAAALHGGRATVESRLGLSMPGGAESLGIDGT